MEDEPLKTYLRMFRRRTGLSQKELGFLLGGMCGKTVRRHEQGLRDPNLRSVLIYEFALAVCVREIFEGQYQGILVDIAPRIRGLIGSLERKRPSALRDKKIAHLKQLIELEGATNSA